MRGGSSCESTSSETWVRDGSLFQEMIHANFRPEAQMRRRSSNLFQAAQHATVLEMTCCFCSTLQPVGGRLKSEDKGLTKAAIQGLPSLRVVCIPTRMIDHLTLITRISTKPSFSAMAQALPCVSTWCQIATASAMHQRVRNPRDFDRLVGVEVIPKKVVLGQGGSFA